MKITAGNMHFRELNEQIRACPDAEIELSLIHISEPTRPY